MSQIVCPSGFTGVLRKLKVREANILADASGVRAGTTFSEVLASCWVETLDPGPYEVTASGNPPFMKLLIADRFFLLIELRKQTYGDTYEFNFQCDADSCRARVPWEIELSSLPVKPVPPESLVQFKTGNRFEAVLASMGRKVWFSLQTGEGEARAAAQAAKQAKVRGSSRNRLSLALASRIVEVEGVHANDRVRFLEELDMDDVAALIDTMDEADGGVESTIEVECGECRNIMEIELPFGRAFWIPTKLKRG